MGRGVLLNLPRPSSSSSFSIFEPWVVKPPPPWSKSNPHPSEIENEGRGRLGGVRPDGLRSLAMRGAGLVWGWLPHRRNPQAARGESLS